MSIDFGQLKQLAAGKWVDIIPALTELPGEVLTRGKQDHPCPRCNGKSVIWPASRAEHTGRIACRNCTDGRPTGDGIATVALWSGLSQSDAAKAVASYLGITCDAQPIKRDLIEQICTEKKMPVGAFMKFGPVIAKRGRCKQDCVRVPLYDETGTIHSHFDFVPGHKGFNARGDGKSGMFFPGRLPQPGETWLLVEGCKDAAALVGLGYSAAGLPTSSMADKYARLFAGCHVVLVPDLDTAGQSGSQKTGGRLLEIAESICVARLPGEVVGGGGDDVRDVLSREGGEQLVRSAIESAEAWRPRNGEHNPRDGRPEVLVTLEYGPCCDQVIEHLGKLGWETPWIPAVKQESLKIYQRGDSLVHVVISDDTELLMGVDLPKGTARIRPLPNGQIPLRITDACQLIRETKDPETGEVESFAVPPTRWMVEGVASRGDWGRYVRRLQGVITAPTIRSDGTIFQDPGYDSKSGLLFSSDTQFPDIPEQPTRDDAQQAIGELLSVVTDFPFVDDADRSAWLAMVLSMIGRQCISGCVPLFAITANIRGAGKSLLVDAASRIAYGRSAARKTFTRDDDELRKTITAVVLEAVPAVLFDNMDVQLGGASLDAALTGETWSDRVLGSSKTTGELPLRTVWSSTGNNMAFGSDIARRVLPIRLQSPLESPEDRSDFKHSDLLGWVAFNRPRLAVAALTVLRAYFVAGKPEQQDGVWGSFEGFSRVIRGALVWAGGADPLPTREAATANDDAKTLLAMMITGLEEADPDRAGITTKEIERLIGYRVDEMPTCPILAAAASEVCGDRFNSRSFGRRLRSYVGRNWEGRHIHAENAHGGVIKWRVRSVNGGFEGFGGLHPPQYKYAESMSFPEDDTCDTCNANTDRGETNPPSQPYPPLDATTGGANDIVF